MNLTFHNCPEPGSIRDLKLPSSPEFLSYLPNWQEMEKLKEKYSHLSNILVIGHGGSINTVFAFCQPLVTKLKKRLFYLWTTDPDYIAELKQELKPQNTLVIAISKSGENVTQLEALSQFLGFPLLFLTGENSALRSIGEKVKAEIVMHPTIGGRYTSFTEIALLPALLAGLDTKAIMEGGRKIHALFAQDNLAFKLASVMFQLEDKGFVDVFMPFYSHYLYNTSALIVQLCHESFGKAGKGQTYFAHEAPESQHHTNQRFFGGRKNICGIFFGVDFQNHTEAQYPPATHSVSLKNRHLADINHVPLSDSMRFEMESTLEDARINSIPCVKFDAGIINEAYLGEFVAFWQLYAVFSSILRGVDPFDQPQVENSKKISFNKRLQFKGLLSPELK
jgi:glucose-6-phosphate isomerase